MKNYKGKVGYTVSYWNTLFQGGSAYCPDDGVVEIAITKIEVMSCGKRQLTARRVANNRLCGRLFSPDLAIYEDLSDALADAEKKFHEWVEGSIKYAKRMALHSNPEPFENFISDLESGKITYRTIVR